MSIDEIKVHVPWFSGLSIYIFAKTHALATESSEARARKVNAHRSLEFASHHVGKNI